MQECIARLSPTDSGDIEIALDRTATIMATLASPSPDPVVEIFEKTKKEFYRHLKDQSLRAEIQNTTSVDDVYNATKRLQEEQGKRGTLRNLRRMNTYLQRLNEYAGILDTFVQTKPDILALIWGPIKLLIHLSSSLVKSMDAILDAMCMIGEKLPLFKGYAQLFAANQRVNHVLALIFRDVLDFHLAALNFFALKGKSTPIYPCPSHSLADPMPGTNLDLLSYRLACRI